MIQRRPLILASLLLVVAITAFWNLFAAANSNCPDEICLSLPEIIEGQKIDDEYYTGAIKVGSTYEDLLGVKTGSYTIDGVNWQPGNIEFYKTFNDTWASDFDVSKADKSIVAVGYDGESLQLKKFTDSGEAVFKKSLIITYISGSTKIERWHAKALILPNDDIVFMWVEIKRPYLISGETTSSLKYKIYSPTGDELSGGSYIADYYSTENSWEFIDDFDITLSESGTPLVAIRSRYSYQYQETVVVGEQLVANGDVCNFMPIWEILNNPDCWKTIPIYDTVTKTTTDSNIYIHNFDPATATISNNYIYKSPNIDTPNEDWLRRFVFKTTTNNDIVIAYNTVNKVYRTHLSPTGEVISQGAFLGPGNKVELAVNDSGGYMLAWQDSGHVYGQAYNASGVAIGAPFELAEGGIGGFISMDRGGYLLAWSVPDNTSIHYKLIGEDKSIGDGSQIFVPFTSNYAMALIPELGFVAQAGMGKVIVVPYQKTISSNLHDPQNDIFVQFKVTDQSTGQYWLSPVRNYYYANPNDGSGGSVSYSNGYSNLGNLTVAIDMPCSSCKSLQLYERKAQLSNAACGSFGDWQTYGDNNTLKSEVITAVDDGFCYQYKAVATNVMDNSFEYTSTSIAKVDRTAPQISVSKEILDWDNLALDLSIQDQASGVSTQSYQLNSGVINNFSVNPLSLTVEDGFNHVKFEVADAAGNISSYDYYKFADLTPADIVINTIEDGGVYGNDLTLSYTLTQELTDLKIIVDGQQRSDLSGLADGVHTVSIQGYDRQGNLIKKTVTFTVNSNLFSISLLSPQARTYENNTIAVQYNVSKTPTRVWYTLNGGPEMTDLSLVKLPDGVYNLVLYAESDTSEIVSDTVQFTVKDGLPALNIVSPQPGQVYSENRIPVIFASKDTVTYQLGSQTGNLTTGTVLTMPSDGNHTLILTATHPVSGNVVSQSINFSTDSVAPDLNLQSPLPKLYTFSDIPIQYSSNKTLKNITMQLDSSSVSSISNVAAGTHTFRISAEDSAGRTIEKQVQFTVAKLDIVSPVDGSEVVSNSVPAVLPFQYVADGGFTSFGISVDQGANQLLTQPPGSVTSLPMMPGEHEILLRGTLNEFTAGKRSQFKIGAKNISAGPGSIDYRYDNCDSTDTSCDVYITLKVKNSGDYDVQEPIKLRFDHIANAGFQTQWQTIPGLAVGEISSVALEPIRAKMGDTFSLIVDPYREITGEWSGDNGNRIKFQTGQITDINLSLPKDDVYLEGVSVLNQLAVNTAGPVSRVEVRYNGWSFIDNQPSDGFVVTSDMGLLTAGANCAQVLAISAENVALDSRNICFQVKHLVLPDVAPVQVPWLDFTGGSRQVMVNEIGIKDIAVSLANAKQVALNRPAALVADYGGGVNTSYQLVVDPAEVEGLPYHFTVENDGKTAIGQANLPNGHAMFIHTIKPSDGECSVDGALPIFTQKRTQELNALLALQLGQLYSDLPPGKINGTTYSIGKILETPILSTFYGTPWMKVSGPSVPEVVKISTEFTDGFIGDPVCLFTDSSNGNVDLLMKGKYRWALDAVLDASTGRIDASAGILRISANAFSPNNTLAQFDLLTLDINTVPQHIIIPVKANLEVGMSIIDNHFKLGPIAAHNRTGTLDYEHRLANGEFTAIAFSLFDKGIRLLDGGFDIKADLTIKHTEKQDMIAGYKSSIEDFSTTTFHYLRSYQRVHAQKRGRICFLGYCWRSSWSTITDEVSVDKTIPEDAVGEGYTGKEVEDEYKQLEPFNLAAINDLSELGLLMTATTGNTELTEEYLACGLFQDLIPKMGNVPLYSKRTGQCALVTDPDYESYSETPFYSDSSCQNEVSYKPTSFLNYCRSYLLGPTNKQSIGNALAWQEDGDPRFDNIGRNTKWTLAHGPTLDILAVSPRDNRRPFVKRAEYRNINGCHLEVDVFKQDINATNLKPLMLIHGGGWKLRDLGALGAQSMVSHLTERGYIVFAPYYRLMGNEDGPSECQIPGPVDGKAPGEMITEDIDAALQWVKANGEVLGATPGAQVTAIGQSAGAHLAGWLATHHSQDIRKVLLFYPPTDVKDFIFGDYDYANTFKGSKGLIEEFLGGVSLESLQALGVNNQPPVVEDNTFTDYARAHPDYPPVFMIHGNRDTVVPVEMSTRMCDALSGQPYGTTPKDGGGMYTCGTRRGEDNVLYVVDGAEHVLDLKCVADPYVLKALGAIYSNADKLSEYTGWDPNMTPEQAASLGDALNSVDGIKLCPSGSWLSTEYVVKPAMENAFNWLN